MRKSRAFGAFLQRHPWAAAILGFLSVYIVWALPALPLFFNWGEWFSYAYAYGDYLVLPLFNAVSFWMIAKRKCAGKIGTIPRWSLVVLVVSALFIVFFEPDASTALETGDLPESIVVYHGVFVWLEFAFILFMLCIYCFSWRAWAYASLWASSVLFFLVAVFLGFVHIADAWFHNFGPLETIAPFSLLATAFILLAVDHRFYILLRLRKKIRGKVR